MKFKYFLFQKLDYVVPCLLIALAIAVSYGITSSSQYFSYDMLQNLITNNSKGNKSVVYYKNQAPGLYKDRQENVKFVTYSGNSINVPTRYHKIIKNTVLETLATTNNLNNIRSTELYDYIQSAKAVSFYTRQYSKIILAISKELNDEQSAKLLKKLGDTGIKISNAEQKLSINRAMILDAQLSYEITKDKYRQQSNKWSKCWQDYLNCKKESGAKCIKQYFEITTTFSNLYNVYLEHVKATQAYKKISKALNKESMAYNARLQRRYDKRFDSLLNSLRYSNTIPEDIKSIVLLLSQEIKIMKDPVSLRLVKVREINSLIDVTQPLIQEKSKYFNSVSINFENNNTFNVQCISSCMMHGEDNCYNICTTGVDFKR